MTEQPTTLRLADALEATDYYEDLHEEAAVELRRLHSVEQTLDQCKAVIVATAERWRADEAQWHAQRDALLEALDEIAINTHDDTAERVARAAIARAEGT